MIVSLASGLVLGLTAGMAPGPLLALVVRQTLNFGTREGAKVAIAPLISDLPIVLAAFWIVRYMQSASWAPALLSLAGAGYIFHLAWGSFNLRPDVVISPSATAQSIKRGAIVNLLNPHPYMFWLTVGAPLMSKAWVLSPATAIAWVVGFYGALVGSKLAMAYAVGRTRTFFSSRTYLWTNRILAVLLCFFAVLFLYNGLSILYTAGFGQ